jgi:glutaminase
LIVPLAAQNRSPVAPAEQRLKTAVNEAYAMYKDDPAGKNADYIPYLAHVNRNLFGIAVVTTDNKCYMLGDTTYSFSIQSISKVFTLALAMEEHGAAAVFQKIGSEPTGRPFNSVIAVVDMPTHTRESAGECRGYSKRRV